MKKPGNSSSAGISLGVQKETPMTPLPLVVPVTGQAPILSASSLPQKSTLSGPRTDAEPGWQSQPEVPLWEVGAVHSDKATKSGQAWVSLGDPALERRWGPAGEGLGDSP